LLKVLLLPLSGLRVVVSGRGCIACCSIAYYYYDLMRKQGTKRKKRLVSGAHGNHEAAKGKDAEEDE
jgi:hypothetical protein